MRQATPAKLYGDGPPCLPLRGPFRLGLVLVLVRDLCEFENEDEADYPARSDGNLSSP